jgi:hypothetical protein
MATTAPGRGLGGTWHATQKKHTWGATGSALIGSSSAGNVFQWGSLEHQRNMAHPPRQRKRKGTCQEDGSTVRAGAHWRQRCSKAARGHSSRRRLPSSSYTWEWGEGTAMPPWKVKKCLAVLLTERGDTATTRRRCVTALAEGVRWRGSHKIQHATVEVWRLRVGRICQWGALLTVTAKIGEQGKGWWHLPSYPASGDVMTHP